jgi:outer membrane receptor protein involved in Fe transport
LTSFYEHSRFLTDNTNTPDGVTIGFGEFLQNQHTTLADFAGGSAQWSTRLAETFRLLSVGADFQYISGQDSAAIFDESGTQIRTDVGRGKQRFVGVFGQADISPVDNLEILASARFQNFLNFDGFDGVGGLGQVPNSSANSFDPRISVRYALTPQFALRAAGYKSFRAPNLDNLYRAFSVPFGIFESNALLKPEQLIGGEAGFDVSWGPVFGRLTGYSSQITDLITFRNLDPSELPPGFFFGTRNSNAGKARASGIDATVDWSIAESWKAALGYAWLHSRIVENELDPASVGKQIAGIPLQQASASLTYADPRGWRLFVRGRWVGKAWGDDNNTLPIGAHFVLDASASYKLTQSFETFLEFQNLLNRRYIADNSGFSPPLFGTPFTVFAGLRVKFN